MAQNNTTAPEELDVTAAEQDAEEHARKALELERLVADGDDSVTAEQIDQQHSLSRFARLRAAGARRKAELAEHARIVRARKDLRAEIETTSVHSAEHLAELLRAADNAVRAFIAAADERDAVISNWVRRVQALGVPHTGAPSTHHEGLGLDGPGDVLAGDLAISRVHGSRILGSLLSAGEYGAISPREEVDLNDPVPGRTRLDRACADLARQSGKVT